MQLDRDIGEQAIPIDREGEGTIVHKFLRKYQVGYIRSARRFFNIKFRYIVYALRSDRGFA